MDERMRPWWEEPDTAGVFLDYDGVLSEIAEIPSAARPVEGARELLTELASRFRLVAIVSGRSAGELLDWLGPEVEIWGVHGAERTREGRVELSERAQEYASLMARVHAAAEREVETLGVEGLVVENKRVMVGLHYRPASDREAGREGLLRIGRDLAEGYGLHLASGKMNFELRPPVEFSKSQVVLARAREAGLKAVAFAGDDLVDLPAFDALDRLESEGKAVLRVAVSSAEAPAELLERADITVKGPTGAIEWLRGLRDGAPP